MEDTMTTHILTTRANFIDFMGHALEGNGMPPIAGRILGLLIFDGEPRSFSDLATELGVSRGSISANARALVQRGSIIKVNMPGDRQDYFQLADESFCVLLQTIATRMRSTSQAVQGFASELPDDATPHKRLDGLAVFFTAMADGIENAAKTLNQRC